MAGWISATARTGFVSAPAASEPDFDWSWAEEGPRWVAPTVDALSPRVARIYDHLLGGKDNYAVDREAVAQLEELVPDIAESARDNRDFVLRAVSVMAEAGIEQFIDLGCGIPAGPSVHEVARSTVPGARVVYVDNDPVVLTYARAALDGQDGLGAVLHDLREPSKLLRDPTLRRLIQVREPVGLIMGTVLHFVAPAIGVQVVGHYLGRIAPGSQVAFSLAAAEELPHRTARRLDQIMRATSAPMTFRTRAQVEQLMDGMRLLPPGITDVAQWRTGRTTGPLHLHAGVAVRP